MSTKPLAAALREAGVETSPDAFLDMVREAVSAVRAARHVDPRAQLSAADVEVLERGGFDLAPPSRRAQSPAVRSVAEYVAMLQDALTVAQAAKRLRVDPSRVRQLLAAGSLYGIKVRGEWRLPSFQFTTRGTIQGVQEVLRELPDDLHPVEVLEWFHRPDPDLEIADVSVSPLAWLRSGGDPSRAGELARDL